MKLLIVLFFLLTLNSCAKKTHVWEDKKVTEKKFDRKLKKFTKNFIKQNPQMVELFNNFEVVYDTTSNNLQ